VLALAGCGPLVEVDGGSGAQTARDCGPAAASTVVATTTVVAPYVDNVRLTLTADHLVMFAGEHLFTMPRCGDELTRVGELPSFVPHVGSDGTRAFWIDGDRLDVLDPATGAIETLATIEGVVDEMRVGSGRVLLAVHFTDDAGLWAVDTSGGELEQLVATPPGDRIDDIAIDGDGVLVKLGPDDGSDRPGSIVRVDASGDARPVLEGVDDIDQIAVTDGFVVLRRHAGAPDYVSILEARRVGSETRAWRIEGDATPDDLVVLGDRIYGADYDSPATRLLDVPGDRPPQERTLIESGSEAAVSHDTLGQDLIFDTESAFAVDVHFECDTPCDDDCGPPWCEITPSYRIEVRRTDF
jgi:hypothetical protein